MSSFKTDREAMDRAAAKLLEAQRRAGNSSATHEQIKRRIIEAVERKKD